MSAVGWQQAHCGCHPLSSSSTGAAVCHPSLSRASSSCCTQLARPGRNRPSTHPTCADLPPPLARTAGIPKFYRWLSERYPLLNMPVTATEAPPEIDNL